MMNGEKWIENFIFYEQYKCDDIYYVMKYHNKICDVMLAENMRMTYKCEQKICMIQNVCEWHKQGECKICKWHKMWMQNMKMT